MDEGHLVSISDTRLYVVERGQGYPLVLLHGGPGLDHHMFGDYLDSLADEFRLVLVDQRSHGRSDPAPEETWTLEQHARDVTSLAQALGIERYAVLGHSYGAFVALQHAVDFPGHAAQTIVSSGLPSARFLTEIGDTLAAFEPIELRDQVSESWEREKSVRTQAAVATLVREQMPFQFADPRDPRIAEFEQRTRGSIFAPDVLRLFANEDYGSIEVEDRLAEIPQPTLVLGGRHDRTCAIEAAELMAELIPHAEAAVFEESGHMTYVEENNRYTATVRDFLRRHRG